MKLDLPVFYFSILPATQPNQLLKINHPEHRRVIRNLSIKYGSPAEVIAWHETNLLIVQSLNLEKDNSESLILIDEIMSSESIEDNKLIYKALLALNESKPALPIIEKSLFHFLNIEARSQPLLSFMPSLRWYGAENRFHFWLFGDNPTISKGIIRGDFGNSYRDSKPVMKVLMPAFVTTSKLAIIVLFLLYFVSIPLGIKMAMPGSKKFTSYFVNLVFALYAMPSFWIALLMITFLCNPAFLNWFPAAYSFIDIDPDTPILQQIVLNIWYLILPVTCWSLAGIAFLSLQTFKKSNQLYQADFIKTARAKGLPEKSIARNIFYPMLQFRLLVFWEESFLRQFQELL
jgi:peptide/nickel transport system permease protein